MSDWDEYDYGEEDPYDAEGNDDYSDEEWGREIEGGPILQSEFKDQERAGGGVLGCWATGMNGEVLKTQTPLGRFCLKVDAVARNINSTCRGETFSNEVLGALQTESQELHRVEFKNPTAFVLGYMATAGGSRSITNATLNLTWECYEKINAVNKDTTIRKPDIIRYARLWMELAKAKT